MRSLTGKLPEMEAAATSISIRDPNNDSVEILRAMLTVAEDELRAKDSQIEYIQQMLSSNEQVVCACPNMLLTGYVASPALGTSF